MTQELPDYDTLPPSRQEAAERSHYTATWFKVANRQDLMRLGTAVSPDVEGYREVVVATTENLAEMPLIAGICLRRAKKNQLTLIATSGLLPKEWTGLPETAGNVTVAADGSLELEGTGPSVGRTNEAGTLFLRFGSTTTTIEGDTLDHVGFDGVDVQTSEELGVVSVSASRDVLETTLATGTTNNWLPGPNNEWTTADDVLITTAGASPQPTVTGLYAPSFQDTRSKILANSEDSPGSFTIPHLSASSDEENRVVCPNSTDLVLLPGDACRVDHISGYWRVVATSAKAYPYGSLPEPVGAAGATGTSELYSRGNHAHAHGSHTDPTNHALAGAAGAGFLLGTSGASDGHVPTVQADGSIAYEAPAAGGVTSHGDLTDLDVPAHHLWALLVDGTRALGGTWSLGGFALTSVGNLTATGTPTWDINGGDLITVDDIIMQGAASQITMSNGQIVNCDTMTFNGDLSILSGLDQQTLHDSGSFIDGNGGTLTDFSLLENTIGSLTLRANTVGGSDINLQAGDEVNVSGVAFDVDVTGSATVDAASVLLTANGGSMALTATATAGADININANDEVNVGGAHFDVDVSNTATIDATNLIDLTTSVGNILLTSAASIGLTATSAAGADINLNSNDEINLNPGNRVDFNSKPAEQMSYLQLIDGDALSGQPDAGTVEIGTYSGPDSTDPGGMLSVFSRLFHWQFPIAIEINNAASGADTVVANINFATARGYDFSNSTLIVRISIMSTRTDSTEAAYDGHAETGLYYVSTNQAGNMHMSPMEQGMPAYGALGSSAINVWQEDNGSNDAISWSETGASTVVITGTLKGNPGTRRLMLLVNVEWAQVPP